MNKRNSLILILLFVCGSSFGAMSFDGANDFVQIPDINESTTTLSVFCFIRTGDTSINKMFMSHYQTTINSRAWYMATANTAFTGADGNEFAVTITSDGVGGALGGKTYWFDRNICDNLWHHVGFTFSANSLKIYLDGEEVTPTKFYDATLAGIFNSTVSIAIGAINIESGSSNGINGVVDDARIYNRVLTADEIRSLALSRNRRVLINSDGLAGHWTLDNGITGTSTNGMIVLDVSPYQNHGNARNGPLWAQSYWISY